MYDVIIAMLLWTAIICLAAVLAGIIADHLPWTLAEAREINDRWFVKLLREDEYLYEEYQDYGGRKRHHVASQWSKSGHPTLHSDWIWLGFTLRRKWLNVRWALNRRIEDFIFGRAGRPANEVINGHLHPLPAWDYEDYERDEWESSYHEDRTA